MPAVDRKAEAEAADRRAAAWLDELLASGTRSSGTLPPAGRVETATRERELAGGGLPVSH
jgi:hypothetical protein